MNERTLTMQMKAMEKESEGEIYLGYSGCESN